ncbi:MAG: hypothetical protein PUC34_07860 [Paludibacteraceae bacterium]|nr:hypothetical protein [Paludibacteraceae bacterium]MDD6747210.1 hypothetical protein [Paludibacteraceae bacterium]
MSESANSAKSAKQIFANFAKFVKPICGTTRRSEGSVTEAEYPTNYQRISNLLLTIRPFRVAILAVLLVFVGGWNSEVWAGAGDITFYASIEASPATGGTVSLSPGTSQKKNSSYNWRGYYEQTSATFLYSATVANSNYVFKGWSTSSTNNSGTTDNPMSKTYYGTGNLKGNATYNADKYYAIFARVTARSTAEMAFGTKLIGVGWNEGATKSVTIDYVHAGNITATITGTNKTEFSLSSSSSSQSTTVVSNNTNSETNSTITVYFKPSSEGNKSATLTISSSNGLDNITIDLTGTGQATVNPEYTCNIENWYYVDDASIDLNSLWTSTSPATKTYSIKADSWTPAGTNNSGATVPAITNNRLSLGQAGTLTIKLTQASYTGYYSGSDEKTIEIRKRPNTIYVKGNANYSNSIYVDSYDNGLTLTADNTDYTNCPITNTQTAGTDIATFYQNDKVVYSSYKLGTATWTLSQPENYKYQAGNGSFTVNVIAANTTCNYVLDDPTERGKNYSESEEYPLSGPGALLTLDVWKITAATFGLKVYGYDANNNETKLVEFNNASLTTEPVNKEVLLSKDYVKIKVQSTGGTLDKKFKNVKVTRYVELSAPDLTIDKTNTNNPVYPSDGIGVGTLPVTYSLAGGGDLTIHNDNPTKFTLSQTTIENASCQPDVKTTNINIQYSSDEAGTDVAHLVIYNKVYRKEVTVTGITAKRNQEVHWEIGDALRVGTQTENAAWVTIGSEVSYSSSNTTLLEVVDGKLVAKAEGEVTITATAPGNDEYNAVEDQKTITITNDLTQSIVWEQNFLRLQLGGANQTLNAYVVSDVEGCTTDRARLITYESSDESVVKVINTNQLQIVGAGQAVLTARQAGGVDADEHKYMAVSAEKAVIVRDPNAPCENYLYIQPQENKWYCGWNLANRQYREFVIDNLDEPSTLYLQYKGEYKTVGVDYFGGTMHVDEWYDGAWHEVPNGNLGTPSIGTYKTLNTTLQRKTTKVRIRTNDGVGYHYFKDCKIGQSRYIEASDLTTFEAKVGQVVNQQLTVRYNNITGPVTLSLGNNNSKFSLSQQSIAGDCGDKGTVDVTVSYLPTVEANEEELLTVSDGTTTLKVTLQGVATKTSRHIVWDIPKTNNVHTVDVVELRAQALTDVGNTTAGDVFYAISSSSPAGVGSVVGSNLTFAKAGTVVVTANTVNDARYNDAVTVSKHYNVALTPTTISTMPVLAEVTSGTAAGEIELTGWQVTNTVNGGVVEGTLAITSADLTNVGTNTVTLTFTPSNTDMYSGCTGTTTIVVNKAVSNIFTNASGNGKWNDPANWSNGVPTGDEPDVIISGDLIIDEELTVGNLTIKKNSRVVLTVNGDLTVNGASEDLTEYGDLHVREGGQVNLSNGTLKVHNFTLDAALSGTKGGVHQNAASGQVANPTKLDVRGDAYFVLTIDPADALTYGWYDFTVPFEVEISNGIYRYGENTPMRSGVDFMIMEYSESRRASGMKGWVNASGTLQPGRAYTITLDKWAYTTYVFKKKTGASTTGTNSFNAVASDVESQTRGWNGLGNGSLSHAQLTDAFSNAKVQLYDHAHNVYVTKEANESNFAVGTAFFIQVSEAQTISFAAAEENRTMMAPSREVYTMDEFRLTLKDTETDNTTDRLWLSASEEATEEYVIGQDLLKMGTPTSGTVAQMWTMKGGKVLCDVETAMNGERATAPLSFYAPKAGQYELAIDQAPEDVTLYLTYNDQVIWVLSFGSYVFDLEKGTTEGYGLRMETNRAPQIATGIDEQTAGTQNRKVMINNTLYIVTDEGAIFDVMGKNIK